MKRFCLYSVLAIVILAAAVTGGWYWGIPDDYVSSRIEGLGHGQVGISVTDFEKTLFFGFRAGGVTLKQGGDEVFSVSEITGRIRPLELLRGRALMQMEGHAFGGTLAATVSVSPETQEAEARFSGMELASMDYLSARGFHGMGTVSGDFGYRNGRGELRVSIDNAKLKGIDAGDMFVPLKFFHTVRAAVELISPHEVVLRSVTLAGKGIYVRVKGTIKDRLADLEIEVMPETDFPEKSLLMLIERYKVSEGYYYIPVKRRI